MPEELSGMPSFIRETMIRQIGPQIEHYKSKIQELKDSQQYKIIIAMQKKMEPLGSLIAEVEPDILKEVVATFEEAKIAL
mgnify:CR=1 FL=1